MGIFLKAPLHSFGDKVFRVCIPKNHCQSGHEQDLTSRFFRKQKAFGMCFAVQKIFTDLLLHLLLNSSSQSLFVSPTVAASLSHPSTTFRRDDTFQFFKVSRLVWNTSVNPEIQDFGVYEPYGTEIASSILRTASNCKIANLKMHSSTPTFDLQPYLFKIVEQRNFV